MNDVEKIEYYLGKDSFKDRYFKTKEFPLAAGEITTTVDHTHISETVHINSWYPNIEFAFNNVGYRSSFDYTFESLKDKKVILCMGCTDTVGLHHDVGNIWPSLIHSNDDYVVLNCGVIGAGADTVTRLAVSIVGGLGDAVKHICVLWPHNNRREFVSKQYTRMVTSHDVLAVPYEDYWDFIDWKSDNYNLHKNTHLIRNLCAANQIQLHDLNINRFDKKVPFDYSTRFFALGTNSHIAIANYFNRKIEGMPSLFEEKKNGN